MELCYEKERSVDTIYRVSHLVEEAGVAEARMGCGGGVVCSGRLDSAVTSVGLQAHIVRSVIVRGQVLQRLVWRWLR